MFAAVISSFLRLSPAPLDFPRGKAGCPSGLGVNSVVQTVFSSILLHSWQRASPDLRSLL